MKKIVSIAVICVIALIVIMMIGPFFIVREGEQAVVTRFGEVVRSETTAGLKLKTPLIETVVIYSSKFLSWDGEAVRIPTVEQQFIWVDTTARWRISDPVVFYANITTMPNAYSRLDGIIDSTVRTVISSNSITEAVRNSNIINEIAATGELAKQAATIDADMTAELQQNPGLIENWEDQPLVVKGRLALSNEMLAEAQKVVSSFGIELIDVVIRQIRYSDDLTNAVYQRMISDRNRIAQFYRSYGEGRKNRLLGELENQKVTILSDAYRRAEEIKGTADAQAARIYADSYGANPEFFSFWRGLESYRRTLPNIDKIMSTDMEYFRYLYTQRGR